MEKKLTWIYLGLPIAIFLWVTTAWILWAQLPGEGWQIYMGVFVILTVAEGIATSMSGKRILHCPLLPVVALGSLVGAMVIMTVISFMLHGLEGVQ